MSRIGKIPVAIPSGVEVKVDGHVVTVKGSKGELTREFNPMMTIKVEDKGTRKAMKALCLTRIVGTLNNNLFALNLDGYSKKLELVGVGYRAALKGSDLEIQLGYSHPVIVKAPENITFEVPSQTEIIVKGISKEQVGQVAADIRAWRKPEPYKGKGVRYEGEYVRRKLGKAAKSE